MFNVYVFYDTLLCQLCLGNTDILADFNFNSGICLLRSSEIKFYNTTIKLKKGEIGGNVDI